MSWLDEVAWTDEGLVPVIAQEQATGKILMFAWMNREALQLTRETGHAVYYSRSRKKLWHKGEESGHTQIVHDIRLDCDNDVVLISVEQQGGIACHTGRHNCFFQQLQGEDWVTVEPVIKDPKAIYHE
jgi:phosphoribosyl-AMP cyclohydrolase